MVWIADGGDDGVAVPGEVALNEALPQAPVCAADEEYRGSYGDGWSSFLEV